MDCPKCNGRTYKSYPRNLFERVLTSFTPFRCYRCEECAWRGVRLVLMQVGFHWQEPILGWVLGIMVALGIAWYLAYDVQTTRPSAYNTEVKFGGR